VKELIALAQERPGKILFGSAGAGSGRLVDYLRFRSFWAMCFAWMGFNGVFYGLLTWGPIYLAETKGFDLKTIGWSTFVIFGSGFVGEIVGGFLDDHLRSRGIAANRRATGGRS
jgi:ACS family D-galactonate transporter-like MFS transporter